MRPESRQTGETRTHTHRQHRQHQTKTSASDQVAEQELKSTFIAAFECDK